MRVSAPTDRRFRRVHVTPRSRRRLRPLLTRLALAALAGAGLLYAGHRLVGLGVSSDALVVRRITVAGNSRLSQGEVLALVDGLHGRNMLLLDLDEWRQKLLASPWVADAALRRVLPGTVDLLVFERRPIGIARLGGGLYLVDERGVIDEFGPHHADLDLPVIDGLAPRTASPGRAGNPAGTEPGSGPGVDEARAALAGRLLASLGADPALAERVSQIDVSDARDAVVILEGDTALVRVGDDQFVERLRAYVDLAPALRERVPQIDYVDLRFGERVYVRPQRP